MILINVLYKELCIKLVIYPSYTELHGQQNIKSNVYPVINLVNQPVTCFSTSISVSSFVFLLHVPHMFRLMSWSYQYFFFFKMYFFNTSNL